MYLHQEFIKITKDSNNVFLFIHGIVGSPNHFSDFVKLVPDNISIYNILLDGHGKSTIDFSRTSLYKWEEQVNKVISELSSTYENIYIVAHSMGTLFAIDHAIKNNKIKGLFLLACPLRLFLKTKMTTNSLKLYFNKIKPNDLEIHAAKARCSIALSKNPFSYIGWIPRFLDLFKKIRKTRKVVHLLNKPTYVIQSRKDEVVSKKAINCFGENKNIKMIILENSTHYYYEKNNYQYLISLFDDFIKKIQ